MEFLLGLLLIIVILIAIVLFRAVLLKPTSAKMATVKLDESERAKKYGEELAKMVRKETISSRFDPDRTKFYEFHEIL